MPRTIPEFSVDAKLVYDRLLKCGVGDVVTYEELSEMVGRDIRSKGYATAQAARKRAMRDNQMVFECIWRVGYKRLSDVEVVQTGEQTIRSMRRAATRGLKRIVSVQEFDKLPAPMKAKHNAYASLFGAVHSMFHGNAVKKLEQKVLAAQQKLPIAATLRAFLD